MITLNVTLILAPALRPPPSALRPPALTLAPLPGVILFAIGNSVGVALNPGADYVINRHDYGLVLADNVQVVAQITDAAFLHEAYAIQMKRATGTINSK